MKKKKWLIPVVTIIVILSLIIIYMCILIGKGFGVSEGVYLETKDGSAIIVCERTPIVMSNRTNRDLFDNLEIGNKILVIHDGIAESYPARTGAYAVFKRNDGVTGAIPPSVIEQLIALGWIDSAEDVEFNSSAGEVTAEPMAYAFEAQYIRTNGYSEDRNYPFHVIINSKEELEDYYEANKEIFDLERKEKVYSDTTIGFLDACDKYDDTYFERQNLVLIVLEEGSGSIRHEITDVRPHSKENGALDGWDITIDRIVPEVGTDDMAQWHLILEVQMGDVIQSDDDVWINGKLSGNSTAE